MSAVFEDVRVEPVAPPIHEMEQPEGEHPMAHETSSFETEGSAASAFPPPHRSRFAPYTSDEFHRFPPAQFAIEGVLPAQGVACIYGPSGAGKSALVTSMVHSLALGTTWFDREVVQSSVWCVVLEGSAGQRNRVEAIEKHSGQPLPRTAKFTFSDLRLTEPEDVDELIVWIKKNGGADVLIIDTLACAMAGGDENSSRDMGLAITGAKALQRATKGLVVLVHHTGKDTSRGLRGHSSLNGALDACIEVRRHEEGYRSWKLVKSRDSEDGLQCGFVLDRVEIRLDRKGMPLSSIVVVPTDIPSDETRPKVPAHKNQIAALECLTAQFEDIAPLDDVDQVPFTRDLAIDAVKEIMGGSQRHRKQRAEEAIEGLVRGGFLTETDGELSLPEAPTED